MDLDDHDIHELGERVKLWHGQDVYDATLARALAIATRTSVASSLSPEEPSSTAQARDGSHRTLTSDAVVVALRAEFLKLLRPN